jgi:monomeric isocitrate dehydrogenase
MSFKTWKTKTSQHILKKTINAQDNRTLMRKLNKLKKEKYIDFDFTNFPNKAEFITIKILDLKNQYESIDCEMYNDIKKIIDPCLFPQSIRLIYYYIKNYNPNFESMGITGLACPSYKEIFDDCKIQRNDITEINKIFHDNMICEVIEGEWYDSEIYGRPIKGRNRYVPNFLTDAENHQRKYTKHLHIRGNCREEFREEFDA